MDISTFPNEYEIEFNTIKSKCGQHNVGEVTVHTELTERQFTTLFHVLMAFDDPFDFNHFVDLINNLQRDISSKANKFFSGRLPNKYEILNSHVLLKLLESYLVSQHGDDGKQVLRELLARYTG